MCISQTNPWCASWLTNKTRYKTYMPKSIDTSTHIFVRTDMVKKSFQPPDNGPYKVVARSGKHYTLPVGGKPTSTSVESLKSAFVDPGQSVCPSLLVTSLFQHQDGSEEEQHWFTYDSKEHLLLPSTPLLSSVVRNSATPRMTYNGCCVHFPANFLEDHSSVWRRLNYVVVDDNVLLNISCLCL